MFTIKNLPDAERFVLKQKQLGSDVYWENYDISFFTPAPHAIYSPLGVWRNEQWGFRNTVPVTDEGTWEVDPRNVRHSGRSRS